GIEGTARRTADAVRKGARATVHGVGGVVHKAGDMATSMAKAMPFRDDAPSEGDEHDVPTPPTRSGTPPHAHPPRAGAPASTPDGAATPPTRSRMPNPLRLFRKKGD
ncbi:hypothetical protein FVW27_11425, partial [Desulfovibrio sp. XJ01]|nr:hypothetical protein [Nitratidesulfovibrio liaohensis]